MKTKDWKARAEKAEAQNKNLLIEQVHEEAVRTGLQRSLEQTEAAYAEVRSALSLVCTAPAEWPREVRQRVHDALSSAGVKDLLAKMREVQARAEKAEELIQEYKDATEAALNETCGKDEKHCTCVPLLRFEAKRHRAEAATYAKSVQRLQKAFDDQCNASRQDAAEIERLRAKCEEMRKTLLARLVELARADAACAEMRDIMQRILDAQDTYQNIPYGILRDIPRALSHDCGKGWAKRSDILEEAAHLCDTMAAELLTDGPTCHCCAEQIRVIKEKTK